MRANLVPMGVALLVASSLAGCLNDVNHAPIVSLTASVTSGDAPLTVYWTRHIFDADGDALVVTLADDGIWYGEFGIPKRSGSSNGTSYYHRSESNTIIWNPGHYTETMTVTDGVFNVTASVQIHVTGLPAYSHLVLDSFSNVTEKCSLCSGDQIGSDAAIGAELCQGFLTNQNGTDCLWFELSPDWVGNTFYSNTTNGADVDLEIRSACTLGADKISLYVHDGYESGNIPDGAGCIVLWTYKSARATIELKVFP